MQAHSPKNGPVSQRKPKERFKRCRGASAVLQQACEVDCHKQCKDMCTASGSVQDPMGATPGTPRHQSWLASALCKAATPGKAARLAFVSGNVDSWRAGPCLRAHIHIHLAEAALN